MLILKKIGNTINPLIFSQRVEKELQTNSQFSPYYGEMMVMIKIIIIIILKLNLINKIRCR